MARPTKDKQLQNELIAAALERYQGHIGMVARHFAVTRRAIEIRIANSKSLQAIRDDVRETTKDNIEASLHRAAIAGEAWAVCFYLKTQAKDRGYSEKLILGGDKQNPFKHQHEHTGTVNAAFTLTAGDVLACREIMAMAGFDVSSDGGPKPVDSGARQAQEQRQAETIPSAQ